MTQYYAWFKQKGEGCDYTIGCGERLMKLNGSTYEEAMAHFYKEFIQEEYFTLDEIKEIIIVQEVSRVDVAKKVEIKEEEEREKSREILEERDRAEYERLKRKYGNPST